MLSHHFTHYEKTGITGFRVDSGWKDKPFSIGDTISITKDANNVYWHGALKAKVIEVHEHNDGHHYVAVASDDH